MADEEQPFLGFDIGTGKRRRNDYVGIRGWLIDHLPLKRWTGRVIIMGFAACIAISVVALLLKRPAAAVSHPDQSCDSISNGYQCQPNISHSWGQYSPYFEVPSEISPSVPTGCEITFAQILSRHGARDPTDHKSQLYATLVSNLKAQVQNYSEKYAFLANYTYNLGADQLTPFGGQQMINSGRQFFNHYANLATSTTPFIRASGQDRVISSAELFSRGFHLAKTSSSLGHYRDSTYPYPILTISESPSSNNTLSHALCPVFEASRNASLAPPITFLSTFMGAMTTRLNAGLPGANLTDSDSLSMMDLCPFETAASRLGTPSPFCDLFSQANWRNYDYYQTLSKYYAFGPGAPFGPTQGVGYANELIARLTKTSVADHTSTNATLDGDADTFPLDRNLYADFGHDNDMTSVFAALGLYNRTPKLDPERVMSIEEMKGYAASWTVPFAGRAVFEKMRCGVGRSGRSQRGPSGGEEEMVRVIVNGRVLPLESCAGDDLGRCTLSKFVASLGFAREGGRWDECVVEDEVPRNRSIMLEGSAGVLENG